MFWSISFWVCFSKSSASSWEQSELCYQAHSQDAPWQHSPKRETLCVLICLWPSCALRWFVKLRTCNPEHDNVTTYKIQPLEIKCDLFFHGLSSWMHFHWPCFGIFTLPSCHASIALLKSKSPYRLQHLWQARTMTQSFAWAEKDVLQQSKWVLICLSRP